ncbi:pyridoxal phosphate-dependent transferase [Pilobolus umbonatus]|nr:pyridoxal phosphate-dependent transferase [Pilobolus umbonatus]
MTLTLKTGEKLEVDPQLFQRCLSYDLTSGLPQLNQWLVDLQEIEHKPPMKGYKVSIGVGSQDVLTKAFEMVIEPGTALLVENPSYTGALSYLKTQPCDLVGVATDEFGLIPEDLDRILSNWPATNPNGNKQQEKPKSVYLIPCGGNPTGASATLERKKKVYKICQKHDLLIFEDDPYYYLQFNIPRVPSYLSLDADGRVLRFDSMSKVLSSGLRIGWVTGPKELVERIDIHTMVTNLQPSGIPQLMAYELLKKWGFKGFFQHVETVSTFYRTKATQFAECLDRRMKGYGEWTVPTGGMFFWIKALGGIKDSYDLIMNTAIPKKNVLAVPGIAFMPAGDQTPYIRVSFSNVSYEQMDEGLRRLAEAIQEAADRNKVAISRK